MMDIILLSIVGALISMIIGSIWHSPKMFGKIHHDYHAKRVLSYEEHRQKVLEPRKGLIKIYFLQFVLSFITSFFLAVVMKGGYGHIIDKYLFMFVALVWISFTVPAVGSDILWSEAEGKVAFRKFISDVLYSLVTFMLTAYIFTLFL